MNKLSDYSEISSFNENTFIVQNGNDIFVKKIVPKELTYIYRTLYENSHANICGIRDIFEYADATIVIEEYIQGNTLAKILEKEGVQNESYTKNIISQLCDGLIFLHRHNIIHRDINPNNIMITNENTVKIINFDISRNVKKGKPSDTVILGTVGYAAPEQFGFSQTDVATDMYAAAVVANVMLTGKMPNEHTYKGRLGRVISKATRTDAADRYRSVSSFKHAFTNEVDENTNKFVKAVRKIPGFRTLRIPKMIFASFVYAIYIPLMFALIINARTLSLKLTAMAGEFFTFAVPFCLITDIFGIAKSAARQKKFYFAAASAVSLLSFLAGAAILSSIF